ncbi:glycerol-3-phosphate acyltransferase [Calothrix sp. NIES-3974]|uniref:glycerol-3-phosphate acyltransferase n=1 Tax=Calothrix sp. NIES-3974 TaxID=2005462 RepID=UPI000B6095B3|nr:glycerol-3-phosphate acyltransferase [Calothrix sp. NIES-3974]BAZ07672.1 pyruvate phosphate dikinase PEP/pyruvate-binding protein [Calothrix sp. NIES-3974]
MLGLWDFVLIFVICPILGALPLVGWVTQLLTQGKFRRIPAGKIGVAAAFYYGGTPVGIGAVLLEAFKGIGAVLSVRGLLGTVSGWELVALAGVVVGRYGATRTVGTINAVWGLFVHDPLVAACVFVLTAVSFSIIRSRQAAKFGVLIIFPLIVAILNPENGLRIGGAIALSLVLAWMYNQSPNIQDDGISLNYQELPSGGNNLFRRDHRILSLDEELSPEVVGQKAAMLSQMKRWGYPVPQGWILFPYDDPQLLFDYLQPSELSPLVVRASPVFEEVDGAAAGLYAGVINVTSQSALQAAIAQVQASYNSPTAIQYRRDRQIQDGAMAILIQQQVRSVYAGVAFSRDPMTQEADAIAIEACTGQGNLVTSGRMTPEFYRAFVLESGNTSTISLQGEGRIPPVIIKQVAYLTRKIESHCYGVPQNIEWCHDGQTLWILQVRPVSTLLPIWTRKIAAEAIPGMISPLAWSIHCPLICSVWGGIFALILGERSLGLDFNEAGRLYFSRAYVNATLLEQIFRRLGLPAQSLEWLIQNTELERIPWDTLFRNLPGLFRLYGRELFLRQDFHRDRHRRFAIAISQLSQEQRDTLTPTRLLARIDYVLEVLQRATYYYVCVPLSVTFRQRIFRVKDGDIDYYRTPDVAAVRSLYDLATSAKNLLTEFDPDNVYEDLQVSQEGQKILAQLEDLIKKYGYLTATGADITSPTWSEDSQPVRQLFMQLMLGNEADFGRQRRRPWRSKFVQSRANLKGQVAEIYARLIAELRWCFLELEKYFLQSGWLQQPGDIFFLELEEIRQLLHKTETHTISRLQLLAYQRRSQYSQHQQVNPVPRIIYGNHPPIFATLMPSLSPDQVLSGIPSSPGYVEGKVKVLRNLQAIPENIDQQTILVVPNAEATLTPVFARAGGVVIETGGRLSHAAILLREYGIPTIVNVQNATWILQDGQQVYLDGTRGILEISNDLRPG